MKTQIKDIVIGIFAVIGFTAVVMGFTNQSEPQQTYGTPESHAWEMSERDTAGTAYAINKITGEVRYHFAPSYIGTKNKGNGYIILNQMRLSQ